MTFSHSPYHFADFHQCRKGDEIWIGKSGDKQREWIRWQYFKHSSVWLKKTNLFPWNNHDRCNQNAHKPAIYSYTWYWCRHTHIRMNLRTMHRRTHMLISLLGMRNGMNSRHNNPAVNLGLENLLHRSIPLSGYISARFGEFRISQNLKKYILYFWLWRCW